VKKAEIVFYLARADNGVIGEEGSIPWRIAGEQRRFKEMTMGKPMAMGRKTFESFPAPLPGRRHIVLTRSPDWHAEGAEAVRSAEEAVTVAGYVDEIAVIGGADIYRLFLPMADRIELTEVHIEPEGDAVVPPFPEEDWEETAREDFPAGDGQPAYSYVTLERRR
jgi:dihydrofolate reductase